MAWLGIGVTPGCGAVTRAATEGAAGVSPAVAAESPGDGAATDSPEGGGGAGRREGGEGGMDAIALRGGGGADPIARAFSGGGGGNLLADIGAREAVGGSGVLPASAGRGGRLGGAPATLGNGGREPTRGGTGTGPRDGGGGGADPLRGGRSPVELGGAGATSSKMSESSISSSDSCCSRSVPARSDALLEFLPAPGRGTSDFGRLALSPLPRVAFAFLARPSPAGRGGETDGAADPDAPFPLFGGSVSAVVGGSVSAVLGAGFGVAVSLVLGRADVRVRFFRSGRRLGPHLGRSRVGRAGRCLGRAFR